MELIGKHFAFELIVGANGRFIVNASRPIDVVRIANIILESEGKDLKAVTRKIKEAASRAA